MIIDVPFQHTAKVVHKGRPASQAKRMGFKGTFPLEVPELTEAQAPLAAWWTLPEFNSLSKTHKAAIRSWNGALYTPLIPYRDDNYQVHDFQGFKKLTTAAPPSAVKKIVGGTAGSRLALPGSALSPWMATLGVSDEVERVNRYLGRHGQPLLSLDSDKSVREVLESDRNAREEEVRSKASMTLIVDGIAYRRIDVPLVQVTPKSSHGIESTYGTTADEPGLCFTLDRWDDAVACLKGRAGPHGISNYWKAAKPEVVDASLLAFDIDLWMARSAARKCIKHLADIRHSWGGTGSALKAYDRPVLVAYAKMRDALKQSVGIEEMTERLEDYGQATEHHGTLHSQEGTCLLALQRLKDRVLNMQDDAELANFAPGMM